MREVPLESIPLWKDTREIDSEWLRHAQIDKLCTALLLEWFNFGPPSDLLNSSTSWLRIIHKWQLWKTVTRPDLAWTYSHAFKNTLDIEVFGATEVDQSQQWSIEQNCTEWDFRIEWSQSMSSMKGKSANDHRPWSFAIYVGHKRSYVALIILHIRLLQAIWFNMWFNLSWFNLSWTWSGWWYTYPSEKYESVGMMTFPIYGKMKFMFQTTNQWFLTKWRFGR